jgi:hypothetical protein
MRRAVVLVLALAPWPGSARRQGDPVGPELLVNSFRVE